MEFLDNIADYLGEQLISKSIIECDEHTFESISRAVKLLIDEEWDAIYPLEAAEFRIPQGTMLVVYKGISFTFIRKDY